MRIFVFILLTVFVLNVTAEASLKNVQKDFVQNYHIKAKLNDEIAMLLDAENTKSIDKADYDDFWIRKAK